MDPLTDPVSLTRSLVDIDSTTGREGEAGEWLARFLRARGYRVTEQPVTAGRFNIYAQLDQPPAVVFSTHYDCVPPYFPSRVEGGVIFTPLYGSETDWLRNVLAAGEATLHVEGEVIELTRPRLIGADELPDTIERPARWLGVDHVLRLDRA